MKKILVLIITFLTIVGCSKSENEGITIESNFMPGYLSKDSVYEYKTYTKNNIDILYKRKIYGEIIWEKPLIKPNSTTIDLGYGEKLELDYSVNKVALVTDNFIYILWMFRSSDYRDSFQIGKYSIDGDFIDNKNTKLNYNNIPLFIEGYNNNILLILGDSYAILNSDLDVIEHKKIYLEILDHIKFISENKYITYNNKQVLIIQLDSNKKISIDLNSFIVRSYPNEINMPRYTISEVKTSDDYVEISLDITLFNGEKNTLNGRFNLDSGELIN